jgi:hypothetical protein
MRITVKTVIVGKPPGKKYNVAEVFYENDRGESKTWKLFDFSNPAVYETLKNAKQGDAFDIVTGKNDKDFTEWRSATVAGAADAPAATPAGRTGSTQTRTSNYETADERAARQVLIVKQSSLAQAVAFVKQDAANDATVDTVLDIAQQFTNWVMKADYFSDEGDQDQ